MQFEWLNLTVLNVIEQSKDRTKVQSIVNIEKMKKVMPKEDSIQLLLLATNSNLLFLDNCENLLELHKLGSIFLVVIYSKGKCCFTVRRLRKLACTSKKLG